MLRSSRRGDGGGDVRRLIARGALTPDDEPRLTGAGETTFHDLGLDLETLKRSSRPLCRRCLDWSERRAHLGGALGAAILERLLSEGMARRGDGRHIHLTPVGATLVAEGFAGLSATAPLVPG